MAEKLRKVTIKSGNHEEIMDLKQEQYEAYMRPWWAQQQRDKRNRDAIEKKGYSLESYEEWKDGLNDGSSSVPTAASVEELVEKKIELEILCKALDTLLPDEREIAMIVLTGDIPLAEYARQHDVKRTTMSDKKTKVLHRLQEFFRCNGFEISNIRRNAGGG